MKWLLTLETDNDPIPACRLMNVFRRKGVRVVKLALAAQARGFSLLAVVESAESDVDHVFNFLRGIGGIRHAVYYRNEPSAEPSFVFIDAESDSSGVARFLQSYPAAKLIFASHGKYLYEVPTESTARWASLGLAQPEFLSFARVKTSNPRPELVGALRID